MAMGMLLGVLDPVLKDLPEDLGGGTVPMNSAEFTKFVVAETAKWAKVVEFAHMRTDLHASKAKLFFTALKLTDRKLRVLKQVIDL